MIEIISIIKVKELKKTCSIRIQNFKDNKQDDMDLNASHITRLILFMVL
jgi:hypothetical protein